MSFSMSPTRRPSASARRNSATSRSIRIRAAAVEAIRVRSCAALATRLGGFQPGFVDTLDVDTAFDSLVLDVAEKRLEGPVVEAFVAVSSPVCIRADVLGVTDSYRPDTSIGTLLDDVCRESVQEVVLSSGFLPTCPLCVIARAVVSFGVVLLVSEVVSVFFQGVTRIQQRLLTNRDRCRVAYSEVDTSGLLTGSVGGLDAHPADEVQLPLVSGPDGTHGLDAFDI